jgi:hypothetical protein
LNDELDADKDGKVYREMTAAATEADKIKSITYSFVHTWGASGGGGESERTVTYSRSHGRTTDRTISHAAMARVKLNQAWVLGTQAGAAEIEGQYDFSYVEVAHEYERTSVNVTNVFDLSKPVHVYYYSTTILTNSGETTIYGGEYISFKEGGEPFTRVITFKDDGVTIDTDVSLMRWGMQEGSGRDAPVTPPVTPPQ